MGHDFPRRRGAGLLRAAVSVAAPLCLAAALVSCAAEPTPTPTPTPTETSPRPSASAPSESPTPAVTEEPGASITLPASCEEIYSAQMLASMEAQAPPLNDPGLTILSTEMAAGLEVLDVAPTIRCTWGQPSEFGLSTNVTIVDAEQSATLVQSMQDTGMTCVDHAEGTICRIETEHLLEGDVYAKVGETHYVRGNGWVATHWVNLAPEGYTEDIVATVWG